MSNSSGALAFHREMMLDSRVDEKVKQLLEKALPGSRLVERHGRFLRIDFWCLSSLLAGTRYNVPPSLKENSDLLVENHL
jgi:hypothetical protein